MSIRNTSSHLFFNAFNNLFDLLTPLNDRLPVVLCELLHRNVLPILYSCLGLIRFNGGDGLELFHEVRLPEVVILGDLLLDLLLVAIVKDGQHEVEQHVQADQQEAHEEGSCQVVDLPEREQDVWEVRRREQHVDVEQGAWDVLEEAVRVLVVVAWKQGVAHQREERDIRQDDYHDC